jgi:hypothetical protein
MGTLFIGDSHANSIVKALRQLPAYNIRAIDVRTVENYLAKSKEIPANISKIYPADMVYCCLGGTEHNLVGLIESEEKFDFCYDSADKVDLVRTIIPNAVIRSALEQRLRSSFARMDQLRNHYATEIICVAPPPPFRDIGDSARLPTAFQSHLERGIMPAPIRMKLYRLRNEMVEEHCRRQGVGYLAAPSESVDSEGYLLRSLWDRDPTHGNAAYGALILHQIMKVGNAADASI